MENIRTENRNARKNHKCSYCGSNIFKGEMYENQTNTFDGVIYDWKSCLHCKSIIERMWKEAGDLYADGINDQAFNDFIQDNNIEFSRR